MNVRTRKIQLKLKLQFFKCPVEACSKRQSILIKPGIKMQSFTLEINMITALYVRVRIGVTKKIKVPC